MSFKRFAVVLILLATFALTHPTPAPAQPGVRIIHFPENKIGTLYLRPAGSKMNHLDHWVVDIIRWSDQETYEPEPMGWREAGDARGAVTVPAGQEAMLALEARKDLPALEQLGSADLQGLMIMDPHPSADYDKRMLRHVGHLTGLRFLASWSLNLSDADLDFLQPLTALEFLFLGGLQIKGGGLAMLGSLTRLDELSFSGGLGDPRAALPEGALRPLKDLPALKKLSFRNCRLREQDLAFLPELTKLEVLNLGITSIGGKDLARLQGCHALRELDLTCADLKDDDLAMLAGLRTLERLNLSINTLTGEGLKSLKGLDRLDTLDLNGSYHLDDRGMAALGELTSLRRLLLEGSKFTDGGTAALGKLVRLERLYLSNTQLTSAGMGFLANLKELRTLALPSTNRMTEHALVYLQGHDKLENLVTNISIGDEGLKALAKLPLKRLPNLDPARISDVGFAAIPRAELIEKFEFAKSRVTDAGLAHLKEVPGVRVLNLQQSKITDQGMAALAGLPDLAELDLTSTTVGDAGLARLDGLPKLTTLTLQSTRIGDAGLKSLARLKGLACLVLSETEISDEGLKDLTALSGLKSLALAQTKVSDAGLKTLGKLHELEALNLYRTKVTDAGLEALTRLPRLRGLSLAGTAVGDGGMAILARIPSLTGLRLSETAVSDEGLRQLAGMRELQMVDLEQTRITRFGAGALQQALPRAMLMLADSGAEEGERPGADLPGLVARTQSGLTLYRCMLEAKKRKIALGTLPAPTHEALRDYFGYYTYADFKPELFWPTYPARWQEGLRRVHRHALLTGDLNNVLNSVLLLPLLFTPEEMGKIYAPRLMMLAVCYGTPAMEYDDDEFRECRDAWIAAVWKQANDRQRNELVEVFFRKPLADARSDDGRGGLSPYSRRNRIFWRAELLPLREWLRANPKRLDALLHDESYEVRQGTLLLAMEKENDLLLNPRDPEVIRLMIEGLKDDYFRENQDIYDGLMVRHSEAALPALRRAFLRTINGQQKMMLCTLLVHLNDAAVRPQLLEYLYGLLAEGESGNLPPWHGQVRLHWALKRLIALDAPAREFLKKKVATCADPQQLAFTILVLHALRGAGWIQWNDRLVGILARGLRNNKVDWDLGLCLAALKLGKPDALAPLQRLMAKDGDKQFQRAARALCAYYTGDMAAYLKEKNPDYTYSYDTNYWEYDDLSDFTAQEAREEVAHTANGGGAGRELKDWDW